MGKILKGSVLSNSKTYECKYDWPDNCFVQYGDRGIVFTESKIEEDLKNPEELLEQVIAPTKAHYRTAFFEAFPRNPNTFIRGEGATVEEAETNTWNKYQKYSACNNHEFERRNYRNGVGFCKHCGLFNSRAFKPTTKCITCQVPTSYSCDKQDNWYCEKHIEQNLDRIKWECEEDE